MCRGVNLSNEELNSLSVGKTINQKGLSSWTTNEQTATNFSGMRGGGGNKVIFVEKGGAKRTKSADAYSTAMLKINPQTKGK